MRTYILAQWSVAVIAKPTINNGKLVKATIPTNIYITLNRSDNTGSTFGTARKDESWTSCNFIIVALSEADAIKYLGELGRIINGYNGAGFWWHFDNYEADDRDRKYRYICNAKEKRSISW